MPAKFHLAQFLTHGPTHHSHGMWRHPRNGEGWDADAWARPELYQHIARVCERGLFDMVFFADLNYISDTYTGSLGPALQYAVQAPEHDPIPLLSFMAAATERIGSASTMSTSHHHPFHASRLWATLDHLTRGRAGWNVVTSLNHNQAVNYGEQMDPTELRYEKASEFIEVSSAFFDEVGGDGFMLSPIYSPGAIEEFVDQVVPELQRRGRFRTEYEGTTQRDHLRQD
jgi:long-chain alkane monooxygenase